MTRCGICRHPLKDDSRRVPLFGAVGPECYGRVSGLSKFLSAFDLTEFAEGPVTHQAVLGTDGEGLDCWMVPQGLLESHARARSCGLVLRLEPLPGDPPHIKAYLVLPDVVGAKAQMLSRLERIDLRRAA